MRSGRFGGDGRRGLRQNPDAKKSDGKKNHGRKSDGKNRRVVAQDARPGPLDGFQHTDLNSGVRRQPPGGTASGFGRWMTNLFTAIVGRLDFYQR
jgi:hypothetical protein